MDRRSLAVRLDLELGGGPRGWADFIVVRNVGPLISNTPLQGDRISTRGFNALVLDRAGIASHFLKVRPAENDTFRDEAEWTVALSRHPAARDLVPAAKTFVDGAARVLAEEFFDADSLEVQLRQTSAHGWTEAAAAMISTLPKLWGAIADASGASPEPSLEPTGLLEDLQELRAIGLDPVAGRDLSAYLMRDLPLASPQHGDFWPRNVLMADTGPKIIDFETSGHIRLPLYDVFHMIRGCAEAANAAGEHWLDAWVAAKASRALRNAIEQTRDGITLQQIETALVAYMVDFVARLYRRGNAPARLAGRIRELNGLHQWLAGKGMRRVLD